jgi:transposase
VHEQVFAFVLEMARQKKLLRGTQVGVDSTTLEANAAMTSIVRRDAGEDWREYLLALAEAEGVEINNDEDLRRFDKNRKKPGKKKVSNAEWVSPVDEDRRIVKMKDGRTHLGYKAEHVVDLQSEYLLSADVVHGTDSDSKTLASSLVLAQTNLVRSGSQAEIKEVAADKGYHANQTLVDCEALGVRTYIPERETGPRRWTDKPAETEAVFRNNRRRVRRDKGKRLQRARSELLERSFAHVCETGGARRTWLRGLERINKRYQIHTAARNLGLLMRDLFGIGKPRVLQDGLEALEAALLTAWLAQIAARWSPGRLVRFSAPPPTSVARNLSRPPKLAAL